MTDIFHIDFYAKDWLLDTQRLTLEERGAFIQIVAAVYHRGGAIENDRQYLSSIMNCSKRKAAALVSALAEKGFICLAQGGAFITQKRAEKELKNAQKRREKAVKNAQKSHENHAKTLRKNAENEGELNKNNGLTSASHQSPDIKKEKNITKKEKSFPDQERPPDKSPPDEPTAAESETLFQEFWRCYPLKIAESKARVMFAEALAAEGGDAAPIMDGLERYKSGKPDWMDFAQAATWLRDRRWRDEWPPDHMDEDAAAAAEKERFRNMPRQPVSENLPGFLRRDAAEMH